MEMPIKLNNDICDIHFGDGCNGPEIGTLQDWFGYIHMNGTRGQYGKYKTLVFEINMASFLYIMPDKNGDYGDILNRSCQCMNEQQPNHLNQMIVKEYRNDDGFWNSKGDSMADFGNKYNSILHIANMWDVKSLDVSNKNRLFHGRFGRMDRREILR